ncbi:MAG: histidine phosphatase family protein [Pirellulaceae bacterium]
MLKILLIRPGSTDFDEQGRIKGTLDVPLNRQGTEQVARTIDELSKWPMDAIVTSPCQSCQQTAEALARQRDIKVKCLEGLKNLDHGLWHGKLIEEVKKRQPKVYRQWQERPETVCPPEGESLSAAQQRVSSAVAKICRKYKDGVVAIVAPEPLASLIRQFLDRSELGDLWKAECDCGRWEEIDIEPKDLAFT